MKRFLIITLTLIMSVTTFAQKNHPSFWGVKIGEDKSAIMERVLFGRGFSFEANKYSSDLTYNGIYNGVRAKVVIKPDAATSVIRELSFYLYDSYWENLRPMYESMLNSYRKNYPNFVETQNYGTITFKKGDDSIVLVNTDTSVYVTYKSKIRYQLNDDF